MKKKNLFVVIYFIVLGIVIFTSNDITTFSTELEYVSCGTAGGIPKIVPQVTSILYSILMLAVPIVLIASGVITLMKAIGSEKEDEINKARGKLAKKFMIAALAFSTTLIVLTVLNLLTNDNDATDKTSVTACIRCMLSYSEEKCPLGDSGNDVHRGSAYEPYEGEKIETHPEQNQSNSNSNSSGNPNTPGTSTSDATADQVVAIRKMMYAVETGGQVYGNQDYGNFTGAYAATVNETAITIGAGGWFATEAQALLKRIRSKDKATFDRLDTANISSDLDNKDWTVYDVPKGSAKANAIVAIISSDVGKKCQDEYMDEQVNNMLNKAKAAGVDTVGGQAMWAEIAHCGGSGAAARILGHASKPYTADSIYKAVTTSWPEDSTLNAPINGQLFRSRHDKFYGWVKQYL